MFSRRLEKLANYKYTLMIIGFALLLSPLIPGIGQELNGSRIWISIGPFSFQPGELAKVAIVLFLAGYLAANREMLSVFTRTSYLTNKSTIYWDFPTHFTYAFITYF